MYWQQLPFISWLVSTTGPFLRAMMAAVFIVEGRVSSNPKQDAGEESAQREGTQQGRSSLKVDDDAHGQPC